MGLLLIVEDDDAILEGVTLALEDCGHTVMQATNGYEALAQMEEATPDLILSDIMMPLMDGYEFYKTLRENPAWALVPFVFITARGEPEEVRRGMLLGVDDYLPKPFRVDDVVKVVETRLARARGIREATEREVDTLKSSIMMLLNHELRTPLTQMRGYAQLAALEGPDLDYDTLAEYLEGLNNGTYRLARLVEDLLLVVELESGAAIKRYESAKERLGNLNGLVSDVATRFESQAAEAGLSLEVQKQPDLPPVEGNAALLNECLNRLVHNAIRYSEPGGTITLHTGAKNGSVKLAVADEGRGIPAEELSYLFDAFHQIDRERYEQQGAGVGLTIANGLVRLHGGRLEVESEEGVGSTFTVVLPLASEEADN